MGCVIMYLAADGNVGGGGDGDVLADGEAASEPAMYLQREWLTAQ
jgi:hypothetical protein